MVTQVRVVAANGILLVCLFATVGCDGGAAKGREDGLKAGRTAGLQKGSEDGQRDGTAEGHEAGDLRARHDAAAGLLPEIYVLPLVLAFTIGIAFGLWAQYYVLGQVRNGIQIAEGLALVTIPGLPRSRIYRVSKAAYGRTMEARFRALDMLASPGTAAASGRVIDVATD